MFRSAACGLFATLLLATTAAAQATAKFTLTSADIHAGQVIATAQVFKGMGCNGGNISPALRWQGAPTKTKSFALTMYDPDAPTGSGWWHWVVYNIPASVTQLASGAASGGLPPGAAQGNTDFGTPGYGGPCPPTGDKPHHYIVIIHALDVDKLDVPAAATAAYVGFNIHAHTLGTATLTALYRR
jgi:Raf kinase inhibitor-like YbhB/YbcL family protein